MGTLYLVATPIGNLEDITLRALRILREARIIAAEDTRVTRRLLDRYQIHTPMISYHEHNKLARLDEVLQALAQGDVALVSDAGTPGLNDPGFELVQATLAAGFPVSPVPGPAAPVAALVGSGLPTNRFLYLGYLHRKSSQRRQSLIEVQTHPYTMIFLETPHRLVEALKDLLEVLGDRPAVAAREMTKLHEEFIRGTLSSLLEYFQMHEPRGEFVLVVGGAQPEETTWDEERVRQALLEMLNEGQPGSAAVEAVSGRAGWRKNRVYRLLMEMKQSKI